MGDENKSEIIITKEMINEIAERNGESKKDPLTLERDQKAKDLALEAKNYYLEKAEQAQSELDYLTACLGVERYGTDKSVRWMFEDIDEGETLDLDTLKFDFAEPRVVESLKNDDVMLRALKEKMDNMPTVEGKVKVVVMKPKDVPGAKGSDYYVLASFPKGSEMFLDVVSKDEDYRLKNEDHDVTVFFKPYNACLRHACSDAYKDGEIGEHYFSVHTYLDLYSKVDTRGGVAEYMLGRGENGEKVTQNSENYLSFALIGGFSNETDRVLISNFWNKKEDK